MGNNPSRPGLDPRHRLPSDLPYRGRTRAYTTGGRNAKYDRDYYEDEDFEEDYPLRMPSVPPGYSQMTYGGGPYVNPHGQYVPAQSVPAQQMLFPQPQMQAGMIPVVPGMGMNGAIPTTGNPFPPPAMTASMGPTMPEPQVVIPPLGHATGVEAPVIPPLRRRGRAATPYIPPAQPYDSSSEGGDSLSPEARQRLQPPLAPGQYGPFDPVRNRTRAPQPILQGNSEYRRKPRRTASSPAYIDSPLFDDPPGHPVIPPNYTGGPPFPQHPSVQPMTDWPQQPDMGMGMPQPQLPVQPEVPTYRPRPFEPIHLGHNPLPAPPRDILHSSPYARLIEELRKPIDEHALKARIAAAPAIHTVGAVNITPPVAPGQKQGTRSSREKKKRGGLFRSLSHRLTGSGPRRDEDEDDVASPPQQQVFVGGQSVAVYPVVQHMPDGSMTLVYNPPVMDPNGAPVPQGPPPVISPTGGMPGYVPSATPATAALNVNVSGPGPVIPPGFQARSSPSPMPMPVPVTSTVMDPPLPPHRTPTPVRTPARMPTPVPTPPPPLVKIERDGELAGLLHFSRHRVHYDRRLYSTGAHLFEALKFLGKRDDLAERVRACGTPEEAVAVTEGLRDFWRRDWEDVKVTMLEEVLYHKFLQHEFLRQTLLATGGADLVFSDPDMTWGDGGIGQGMNLVGRALMRVRSRLRQEGLDS